jgi:hypothetical protein
MVQNSLLRLFGLSPFQVNSKIHSINRQTQNLIVLETILGYWRGASLFVASCILVRETIVWHVNCVHPMIVIVNLKDILFCGILPYPSPKPMHIILHDEIIIA